ncbi:fumarylacetoacetate hydrolase family protein [Salegentibacter sp. JZCK2]|uniref:2-keto-4-pentenoate hydratase n=1 Tax=Salegentibacter tibetensis TaxID=2873600 RepID=UPI001CCBF3DB|nr:fumarylacetoacetate hydrolase family protein [Salegentibacter tibetensis]MBZ9731589.1 fumarylacetoacetate hydrolase family protein [Salegentibacter tibetensis]
MRNFKLKLMYLAVFALIFTSCSKDENTVNNEQGSVTLTFGTALQDFSRAVINKQEIGADVGECIDGDPAFAQITIEYGDSDTEVMVVVPILEDANGYFTGYDEDLEIPVASSETHVSVSLTDFVVWTDDDSDGEPDNVLWVAPKVGSEYAQFVTNPLGGAASTWNLRAGSKTYLDVEVLCVDDRDVNLYGYQFFDIEATEVIEFCIFGNYCDENGRHYSALYSVNIWSFENGVKGNLLHENLQNTMDMENGDYYTSPVCMFLPDGAGMDEYYIEITLRNSDAYEEVEERIIRAGVINDDDVRGLMDGDDNVDYYHFQEGNCGDIGDSPDLLGSELFDFIDDYAGSFFNIEPFPALTPMFPDMTINDAYDFQDRLIKELENRGVGTLTGYKLGFTGDERPFGAPKPIYGRIYSSFEVPNGSTLSLSEDFIGGSVGFEVAIIMGRDVTSAISPEEAKNAVKAIAPAFEFADFGFTPNNMVIDFRDIIATNSAARTYILGEETQLENLLNQDIDPDEIELLGTLDRNVILDAKVGLPLDGIFKAVSFLSAELASRGESLKAGDIILTGAIRGDQNEGLGTYVGDYGILGTIQFTLVE